MSAMIRIKTLVSDTELIIPGHDADFFKVSERCRPGYENRNSGEIDERPLLNEIRRSQTQNNLMNMDKFEISECKQKDFAEIYEIINDAAKAYRGIIPEDRWHEPYMSKEELQKQIDEGVQFWKYTEDGSIMGIMGIQFKGEVTLIRHAYVRTINRNKGIGGKLLLYLHTISTTPVLIGTWADAKWAIEFYRKHGFRLLEKEEKDNLLRKYWTIPDRQAQTSVVLASTDWGHKN